MTVIAWEGQGPSLAVMPMMIMDKDYTQINYYIYFTIVSFFLDLIGSNAVG